MAAHGVGAGHSVDAYELAPCDSQREHDVTNRVMADTLAMTCGNDECRSKLYGPVKFCPYCGQLQQKAATELRVAEPPPPPYGKPLGEARAEYTEQTPHLVAKGPAQPVPPTPTQTVEPMLEVDWEPSSPPISVPAEPDVPAQQPKEPGQQPTVVDVAPPELPITQPPRRIGAYIAGAVIAIGAYTAWSMFIKGPAQPETVPPVIEQPPVTTQEPVTVPSNPPPQPQPASPSVIDTRLAEAQTCLRAGDYGCTWRAARAVLDLEPGNDAALSVENEVLRYVDQRVADSEQALQAGQLAAAETALDDAQKAFNYDVYDARFDALNRRLYELRQAEQRGTNEAPGPSSHPADAAPGPDPVAQELLAEAQQSLALGNIDAAESLANKVLQRDPGNASAPEILRRVEAEKERIKAILMGSTEVKESVKVNR